MIGLGGTTYWVGPAIANQGVKITFDPADWRIILYTAGSTAAIPLVRQGLTKAALMGAVSGFLRLPSDQLSLPLDPAGQPARGPGPPCITGCKAFSGVCEPAHTEGLTVGSRMP